MQGQVLNKITNRERKLCWGLFLANIWTETSGYVRPNFPSKALVTHNNEVYYCRIQLCTGDLRCPNYSWDPNWATCTNQASESAKYKNGNLYAIYISFLHHLLNLHLVQVHSLSWPRFKRCRYYFQLLLAMNITTLSPTPCL